MVLSEQDKDELVSAAGQLLDRWSSPSQVRAVIETAAGFDAELWAHFVELGWTGVHVPESLGGAGAGYGGLEVVLHQIGRHLTPSPFLASAVLGTEALLAAPVPSLRERLVPRLAAGDIRATVALAARDGSYDVDRCTVRWGPEGSGVRLSGEAGYVLDADVAAFIFVSATSGDGTPLVAAVAREADGVAVSRLPMVDRTQRLFSVSFDSVSVRDDGLLAEPGEQACALIERIVSVGSLAVACDAVGAAAQMTEMTAEYVKERRQFGRPVGSFQAVKHICADMVIHLEASRAAVRTAFEALDEGSADVQTIADVTSSYTGPACSKVCGLGIRAHGGIGFTWEHEAHMYLKRAKLDEMLMGSPVWHRRRLSRRVFPEIAASWGRSAVAG